MKTIIVDDEIWALNQLKSELSNEDDIEICGCFMDTDEALQYAEQNKIDFALLDVQMPGLNGLKLGALLRKKYPDVIIVYVSSYPEYFSEAFRNVRADYYMLKPYRTVDVKDVVERARLLSKRQTKRVQIRTFGRFDVFVDGQVVSFRNTKAKELLALCVHRKGGYVRMEEAIDKLWEASPLSENVKTRYRKAVAYLNALFVEYRLPGVFISEYGKCHIEKDKVSCDYYDYLQSGDAHSFFGQYLHDYSWAEETAAWLELETQNDKYK